MTRAREVTAQAIDLANKIQAEAREAVEDIEKAMRFLRWPPALQSIILLAVAERATARSHAIRDAGNSPKEPT